MPQVDEQVQPRPLTAQDLRALMEPQQSPCVSIYVRTAPGANADQGRIRFKSAVKQVEQSLGKHQDPGQHEPFLRPLRAMEEDDLWLSQSQSLGVFLSPDQMRVRQLGREVGDVAVVADTFHVKPLIRVVQDSARYQVLCVSSERVALYTADGERLEAVPLHQGVPRSMAEALGDPSRVTKTKRAMQDPDDRDTRDRQLTRYFRRLDEAITEHHSRRSDLPLVLAALPEYHAFFHDASHNPRLIEAGVKRDPFKGVSDAELGRLAWQAAQPQRDRALAELRERYDAAAAYHRATDQIEEAARQAVFSKVDTLLLEDGRHVGGVIDPGTGHIDYKPMNDPDVDDALDDLAEIVMKRGGQVRILPPEQMPTQTGVAAILRHAV